MKLLLIDNNDSFTYNIVDILRNVKAFDVTVILSGTLTASELSKFDKFIISPGPGKPNEYPIFSEIISHCIKYNKPLLGICLGHQAICEYFGGKLIQLNEVTHGQSKNVIVETKSTLYKNIPSKINAGLYHSWVIEKKSLPNFLKATGKLENDILMSVEHKEHKIYGVQYHPESFMTEFGADIIENFLEA